MGVEYVGRNYYRSKNNELRPYILIYTCTLTRGLHLELLSTFSYEEFLASFKRYRFLAVCDRLKKIISDDGKTFHAAWKWIKKQPGMKSFTHFPQDHQIQWQFNVNKANWWGGMSKRMVGLVKNLLYKVNGAAKLTYKELQDVSLDIQIALRTVL